MEEKDFIEQFYEEYGFYPSEGINSWEKWNESQKYDNKMKTELAILKEEVPANEVVAVFIDNDNTGGVCCFFKHNGKYYYADKSLIPFSLYGGETMIFPYDFNKQVVTNWNELYADRTGKSLEKCVMEFTGTKNIRKQYINKN